MKIINLSIMSHKIYYKVLLSNLLSLYKLLSHSQEVIFLMSCLLNDIEKRILHNYFSNLFKFVTKHQVFMVREVSLLLR